jgi:hypothetical protein
MFSFGYFSSRPRDNLRTTERAALKTLKDNVNLTILPADKGNTTVVLNTSDYKQKISDPSGRPSIQNIDKGSHRFNRRENQ